MEICVENLANSRFEWVALPIEEDEFGEVLERLGIEVDYGELSTYTEGHEFSITDIESDLACWVHYFKSATVDDICNNYIWEWAYCEDNYHDEAVAISEVYSIKDVDISACKNATLIRGGIESSTDLGHYIVDNGLFGYVLPEGLEDYLDYEKIGDDWEYDGNYTSVGFLMNL